MTTPAHTPGPWSVGSYYNNEVYSGDGRLVAEFNYSFDFISETTAANARLCAAAPELLDAICDALVFVEDAFDDPTTGKQARACSKKIRAAIAKAEGR